MSRIRLVGDAEREGLRLAFLAATGLRDREMDCDELRRTLPTGGVLEGERDSDGVRRPFLVAGGVRDLDGDADGARRSFLTLPIDGVRDLDRA